MAYKEPILVVVTGCTNSGKTTFLELLKRLSHSIIDVGAELRKRHPPEYFEGSAAPAKTQEEAWKIFKDKYEEFVLECNEVIFTAGQPRDIEHAYQVVASCPHILIVNLFAPHDVRLERAKERDDDAGSLELSAKRMDSDYRVVYESTSILTQFGARLISIDATQHRGAMIVQLRDALEEYGVRL